MTMAAMQVWHTIIRKTCRGEQSQIEVLQESQNKCTDLIYPLDPGLRFKYLKKKDFVSKHMPLAWKYAPFATNPRARNLSVKPSYTKSQQCFDHIYLRLCIIHTIGMRTRGFIEEAILSFYCMFTE